MNRGQQQANGPKHPLETAGLFSKLSFWWLKPLYITGLKRPIEDNDLYKVHRSMQSEKNTEKFSKIWEQEKKRRKPSIFRSILNFNGYRMFIVGLLYALCDTLSRVIQPLCLGGFVAYFAQSEEENSISRTDAYWYASGIVLAAAFVVFAFHPMILYICQQTCNLRTACSGVLYRKSLRLSKSSAESGLNGKIINLLSNDLSKLDLCFDYLHDVWKGPIEAITFFVIIYFEIGISGVIGMAFLVSFIPLQAWIGKRSAQLGLRVSKRTDFRVKIMNEILLGIQVIKMYAWEKSFALMIDNIRKKEVDAIRGIANIHATITSFTMVSKVSIGLSFLSYVYFGNVLTARKVFIVSSYFDVLNLSMVYYWPLSLTHVAEGWVAMKRLEEFLLKPETKPTALTIAKKKKYLLDDDMGGLNMLASIQTNGKGTKRKKASKANVIRRESNNVAVTTVENGHQHTFGERIVNATSTTAKGVHLENATAAWSLLRENDQNGIFNVNVRVDTGLCAIIGQVGSGKSTLLNAILGEIELDHGKCTMNGKLSYASQEPWVFESTVRDNIVFVEGFDEERYNKVIQVCALERDFQLLPLGDLTVVSERGASLSGGQRARVNLARAIYKKADIYLLDDPLTAVDAHVGKHIFEKCIREFLSDKICILVTHQLQYLKDVEHVILMSKGRIEAQGPFVIVQQNNNALLTQDDSNVLTAETVVKRIKRLSSCCEEDIGEDPNDRKEGQAAGTIKWNTYKMFFQAVHSTTYVVIVFVLFVLAQIGFTGCEYFLSEWVNFEESAAEVEKMIDDSVGVSANGSSIEMLQSPESIVEDRQMFIIVYAIILVVGTILFISRSVSFFNMCLRISTNMHDMLFRGISRAPMLFFNLNPSGRILNRFARDINSVDSVLPNMLLDVVEFFLNFVSILIIVGIVNPWLLIPAVIMTILFYVMRYVFIYTARSLKRLEALNRSPIYNHMNVTLQGLPTIRAFYAHEILEKEFHHFQDCNTSPWYLFVCATRSFALWLDVVCLVFIAFVTFSFLFIGEDVKSGSVGLAILSSINLVGLCQWGMRQTSELENQMVSVERLVEYAELPSEPPLESEEKQRPPVEWPAAGAISFKSLSMRYAENASRTLRNLTFHIEPKEKIGIVGRTGAGKSSMIQALFRLAYNDGQIIIDDIDTQTLGLHDLRKKISIIPQDPVLFSGSLRFNLDPFGEKTDSELWDALEQVELKPFVSSLAGGIDCQMLDGGSNFSVGQRQLVCLARAILRNNKVLIMDEATANVDSETDRLIQVTIRSKFANCTVLTIAHRLHTVMDSDRVLVVDAGEVVEFAHPFELLKDPNGFFKRLVDQTGSATASSLALSAKESYDRIRKDE